MAVVCGTCGKSVSDAIDTCYFCGSFLKPPSKCGGCGRDVPASQSACKFCGRAVAAASAAVAAPSPAPANPPPAPAFQPILQPAADAVGDAPMDRDDVIDLVLLVLALPVVVWGLLVILAIQMALMMRGGGLTIFKTIADPNPAALGVSAAFALVVSFLMYNFSTPESGFFMKYSFFIMLVSAGFGVALIVRKVLARRRQGVRRVI